MHDLGEVLKRYCFEKIVIETGTYHGKAVKFFLDHGASEVRSVEGDKGMYGSCVEMFSGDERVRLWNGFSSELLWEMIADIEEEAVFFLDAHPSGVGTFGHDEAESGESRFGQEEVLLAELQEIARHPINTHTIIIDDQHTHTSGVEAMNVLKKRLLEINPQYKFSTSMKQPSGPKDTWCCLIAEII